MNKTSFWVTLCISLWATAVSAQELAVNGKTVKVGDLPEYVIISADNSASLFVKTIRIIIQTKNSKDEKSLTDLLEILDGDKYLNLRTQGDILNAMSTLGYDYVNAFPQNSREQVDLSRTAFVFRKKEKYRA